MTVIPTDDYQPKIGAAAGSEPARPLRLRRGVRTELHVEGLFLDITDRINALPFASNSRPVTSRRARWTASNTSSRTSWTCRSCSTTRTCTEGRPRPGEAAHDAQGVRRGGPRDREARRRRQRHVLRRQLRRLPRVHLVALGLGRGGQVMNPTGTSSLIDQRRGQDGLRYLPRSVAKDGITAPGTKEETGPTWTGFFPKGKVGVMPMPASTLGLMPQGHDSASAPIPGLNGGESTFVGGDAHRHLRDQQARRRGLGLPGLVGLRRGPGRRPGQEPRRRRPHRPGQQQVLRRRTPAS